MSLYDASSSALGYIYQVRYALYSALSKIQEVDDPDLFFVSLEVLDDVAFESGAAPVELLQLKYHGTPANLTNRSPDIWKTFRIWAENLKKDEQQYSATNFYLLTTEVAQPETLAWCLSLTSSRRNTDAALKILKEIVSTAGSKENQKGYDAVNCLSEYQLKLLVDRIYVVDKIDNISMLSSSMEKQLRMSVSGNYIKPFLERLEGIWFSRTIKNLEGEKDRITIGWLIEVLDELREQFSENNLPDDSEILFLGSGEIDEKKVYIKQLKLFTDSPVVLRKAQETYYKSYSQIQRWQNDGLIYPGEKSKYFKKLFDEWEEQSALTELKQGCGCEDEKRQYAKALYSACQTHGLLPIRKNFTARFVARGSYQQLADRMEVGWHPDFTEIIDSEDK